MFRVAESVVLAAWVFAVFAAPALAQPRPTEAQLQSARERLQQAMEDRSFGPATYDRNPVPDFAVPERAPYVLPHAPPLAPAASAALSPDAPAAEDPPPAEPATAEIAPEQSPPVKKSAPPLQSGRAAAAEPRKPPAARKKPAAPRITLPDALRP